MAGQKLTCELHSLAVIAQEDYMLLSSLRLGKHSFARESQSLKCSNRSDLKPPGHISHIYSKEKNTTNVRTYPAIQEVQLNSPAGRRLVVLLKQDWGIGGFGFCALGLGPSSGDLFHP